MTSQHLLPLGLTAGLLFSTIGLAQTPAPAAAPASAAPAAASASASAPAGSAPGGRRGARPAVVNTPLVPALPIQPWDRPAEGKPVFTEDFESGALNDKTWTLHASGNATITVQQDMAAHGKSALKVTYPAGTQRAYAFVGVPVPESLRDHFYGRAYMYISGVPDPHSVFMLAGTAGFPRANWLEIGGYTGQFQPSVQIASPTPEKPNGEAYAFQGTLPIGRWFCLEWEYNDKPDRIVLWVDGKLEVNVPITYNKITNPDVSKTSGLIGGFAEFNIGYRTFAQGALITKDLNIYYDDIAIGDKPIGQLTPVPTPAAAK